MSVLGYNHLTNPCGETAKNKISPNQINSAMRLELNNRGVGGDALQEKGFRG